MDFCSSSHVIHVTRCAESPLYFKRCLIKPSALGRACASTSIGVRANTFSLAAMVKRRVQIRYFKADFRFWGFWKFGLIQMSCMEPFFMFFAFCCCFLRPRLQLFKQILRRGFAAFPLYVLALTFLTCVTS